MRKLGTQKFGKLPKITPWVHDTTGIEAQANCPQSWGPNNFVTLPQLFWVSKSLKALKC